MTAHVIREANLSRIVVALLLCTRSVQICAGIGAEIDLDVEGSGFHRTLIYRIHFENLTQDGCRVAIYMKLPSALYVNTDEIAEMRRRGTNMICSVGETDVELFAEKAGRQNVTTCASISSSFSSLTIPVHQRYRYAHETGGYVNVTLPEPKLLLGCRERVRDHRVSKIDLCEPCVSLMTKWREIPYRMSKNREYVWPIPVGDLSLSLFVTCATLLTTIIGAIFIGHAIWTNADQSHPKED
ncbi:phosphatidylinositol-glycan biosynthesis class X protein [Temnothorax nylanderi]|uniref:phosphatidylinositol-glycan biosynthesis class X protein n=1 Tax=Temnothorax nylanderi TaxID=102681 RepID=UPI003A8524AA